MNILDPFVVSYAAGSNCDPVYGGSEIVLSFLMSGDYGLLESWLWLKKSLLSLALTLASLLSFITTSPYLDTYSAPQQVWKT